MFERFRAEYALLREPESQGQIWWHERFAGVEGYPDFAGEFAGATFSRGLYRIHDDRTGPQALTFIAKAFPEFAVRVCPFGYDWLGRQLAIDSGRVVGGQPQVLLLEPGTGEALEIPLSFAAFHDEEVIDYADAALAKEFFTTWTLGSPHAVPLGRDRCVGYRVPLFLGGQDDVENLEVSDLELYWSICGQLRNGVRALPPGASISEVAGVSRVVGQPPVTRADLRQELERRAIPSFAYGIGRDENEAYCLVPQDDGWHVYYSERGKRNAEAVFDSESAACGELLRRLLNDETLQRWMEEHVREEHRSDDL